MLMWALSFLRNFHDISDGHTYLITPRDDRTRITSKWRQSVLVKLESYVSWYSAGNKDRCFSFPEAIIFTYGSCSIISFKSIWIVASRWNCTNSPSIVSSMKHFCNSYLPLLYWNQIFDRSGNIRNYKNHNIKWSLIRDFYLWVQWSVMVSRTWYSLSIQMNAVDIFFVVHK